MRKSKQWKYYYNVESREQLSPYIITMTINYFAGDVGGLCGLFLGCSVLSLCEVGDLLGSYIMAFIGKMYLSRSNVKVVGQ